MTGRACEGWTDALRAYGNGLDLETAAEFYGSVLDLICGIQPQQTGQLALL